MGSEYGSYDHLNKDMQVHFSMDMDTLARAICTSNYGTHRLLCALIRARRENSTRQDELMELIEAALNRGLV